MKNKHYFLHKESEIKEAVSLWKAERDKKYNVWIWRKSIFLFRVQRVEGAVNVWRGSTVCQVHYNGYREIDEGLLKVFCSLPVVSAVSPVYEYIKQWQ